MGIRGEHNRYWGVGLHFLRRRVELLDEVHHVQAVRAERLPDGGARLRDARRAAQSYDGLDAGHRFCAVRLRSARVRAARLRSAERCGRWLLVAKSVLEGARVQSVQPFDLYGLSAKVQPAF